MRRPALAYAPLVLVSSLSIIAVIYVTRMQWSSNAYAGYLHFYPEPVQRMPIYCSIPCTLTCPRVSSCSPSAPRVDARRPPSERLPPHYEHCPLWYTLAANVQECLNDKLAQIRRVEVTRLTGTIAGCCTCAAQMTCGWRGTKPCRYAEARSCGLSCRCTT